MIESDRKLLTEFLGECWNDEKSSGWGIGMNRSFTTWQDLGALKEKLVEKSEWDDFCAGIYKKHMKYHAGEYDYTIFSFMDWLFQPENFCQLVADYLKEKP